MSIENHPNQLILLVKIMVSHISADQYQRNGFVLRIQEKERNRLQEYAEMLVSQEAIDRASQFKGARQHARINRGAPAPAPL
ncbi:hypothetical protein [Vreelandella populi]|uniref:Uncharacterized protein n=1 Tax=Vreelandella populi TaxID=2498858 RepID=A0A433LC84_9GAMM|nr:hypothetical protein [Halomonas populi]RUR46219.1 hypothetical protein ELY37_09525 [Halomonas populi]